MSPPPQAMGRFGLVVWDLNPWFLYRVNGKPSPNPNHHGREADSMGHVLKSPVAQVGVPRKTPLDVPATGFYVCKSGALQF